MQKQLLRLIPVCLCAFSCQPVATDVLQKSRQELLKLKSVQYKADLRVKFSGHDDTLHIRGAVLLAKAPHDTTFGYYLNLDTETHGQTVYHGNLIYAFDHQEKVVYLSDPAINSTGMVTGNIKSDLIEEQFTSNKPYEALISGEGLRLQPLRKLKTGKEKFWLVKILLPDSEHATKRYREYRISRKTLLPRQYIEHATDMEGTYHSILALHDLQPNPLASPAEFPQTRVPDNYEQKIDKPVTEADLKLLDIGTPAPLFELQTLHGDNMNLADLKGKLVLIDFWYMSCFPCQQALPHLQALQDKYREQGLVVLGLNSNDNNEKYRKKLPDFLKKRDITYTTLLGERSLDQEYLIRAYPSLYLLDRNGHVAFTQLGFGDATPAKLEAEIEKLLAIPSK